MNTPGNKMSLQTIDKPNLYFSAQLLINNILAKISASPQAKSSDDISTDHENLQHHGQLQYHLFELKQIFKDNVASTTTHLEAISDLVKTYYVCHGLDATHKFQLVTSVVINAMNNTATFQLNPQAVLLVNTQDFNITAID